MHTATSPSNAARPPLAAPRALNLPLPMREAFLRLTPEERRRRLSAAQESAVAVFSGVGVLDDFLAEKRREAARES